MENKTPQFTVYAKRKNVSEEQVSIYIRIQYDTDKLDRALSITCKSKDWNAEDLKVENDATLTRLLREKADQMKQKIMGAFYILTSTAPEISLHEIVAVAFDEKKPEVFSVFNCFDNMISRMKKYQGTEYSTSNIQKHQVCRRHLREFVTREYRWNEFPFSRINRSFIDRFVEYLKNEAHCSHNTSMKHLAIFKKVYKLALDNHWIKQNAFSGYKMPMKRVDRQFLSEEEIMIIIEQDIPIKRLDAVRNLFVFACFTGLAYIDVKELRRENIKENLDLFDFLLYSNCRFHRIFGNIN